MWRTYVQRPTFIFLYKLTGQKKTLYSFFATRKEALNILSSYFTEHQKQKFISKFS